VTVTWDPGDGKELQTGVAFDHEYAKPGIYEVTLRIVRGERLQEYSCEIAVARDVQLELPLVSVRSAGQGAAVAGETRTIRARVTFPSEAGRQSQTATTWHIVEAPTARRTLEEGGASDPNEVIFDLPVAVVKGDRPLHLAYRSGSKSGRDVLLAAALPAGTRPRAAYGGVQYRHQPGLR